MYMCVTVVIITYIPIVVQNTVVEKKALEGENKKMRKFMRQSVISPGSSLNGMGASHMTGTGSGSGSGSGGGSNSSNSSSNSAMVDAEDVTSSSPFTSVPSFDEKL